MSQVADAGAPEAPRGRRSRRRSAAAPASPRGSARSPPSTTSTSTSRSGSFFALLGPSGCGKTTTLRMVAGLEEPTAGTIMLGDRDITTPAVPAAGQHRLPELRAVPAPRHLRERRVRAAPPQAAVEGRRPAGARDARAGRARHQAAQKPAQLSGGQQQRVALARALVNRPEVLLLDEPLGALDLKLRRQMQIELKRIQTEVGITFVHVTHDQEEAMTMADTIAVMNAGGSSSSAPRPTSTRSPRPRSWPTSSASPTCSGHGHGRDGDHVVGRRARQPASRCPPAARPDAEGDGLVGVRPEKVSRRVGRRTSTRRATARRRRGHRRQLLGVSTQYLVRMPWGQELTVFAQNTGPAPASATASQVDALLAPGAHLPARRRPGRRRRGRTTVGRRAERAPPEPRRRRPASLPAPGRPTRRAERPARRRLTGYLLLLPGVAVAGGLLRRPALLAGRDQPLDPAARC